MQERSNKLYETMDPVKLFFHAAIPGVISMFSMSIYNIIEGIFVGQLIGGEAFAAMNLAMPLVMLNYRRGQERQASPCQEPHRDGYEA